MEEKIFEKDFSYRARVNGKDGVITVRPEEKGKPTKKNVVQVGKAQMWSTTGKRNPRRFVQLEASEKAGDLIGEMKEQFDGIIAELGGTPSPDPMERPLTTQDSRLEVWLSKERHQLVVKKTVNLKETPDYGTEISNLEAELRRCLLINRTSLLNASRA
jgi:hypothetical protein